MATRQEIESVKQRIAIEDVVGRYVALKKAGRNYKALCPFHSESTPSFMVNPELGIYKCFGCGEGGDVFAFLEKIEGLEFGESLEKLAREAGVPLTNTQQKSSEKSRSLFDINRQVAKLYERLLWDSPVGEIGRRYIKERGITEEVARIYGLGYAPDEWETLTRLLPKQGVTLSTLEQLGLVLPGKNGGYYDRFRHRLMFPIRDGSARVVGFSGRQLNPEEQGGKYINSPDSELFHKSDQLYGYDLARSPARLNDQMILVEGNLDVLRFHQIGQPAVVAPLGTALTKEQLRLIRRVTTHVLIAFDSDSAGIKATLAALELAENEGLDARVMQMPEGDPDSYLREHPDAFETLQEQAQPVMRFVLERILSSHDLDSALGKQEAANAALERIVRLTSQVTRMHYLQILSTRLEMPLATLQSEARRFAGPQRAKPQPTAASGPSETRMHSAERELLELLLADPSLIRLADERLAEQIEHPGVRVLVHELKAAYGPDFRWSAFYDSIDATQQNLIENIGLQVTRDPLPDADTVFMALAKRIRARHLHRELEATARQIAALGDGEDDQVLPLLQRQQSLRQELDQLNQEEDASHAEESD